MGIIHLVGNMAALEMIGTKIEKKTGPAKILLIYNLGTILTAFLWCLVFPEGKMVGASLGIFVLLGMMCMMLFADREKKSIAFSRYDKGYLIFYVIVGNLLKIDTLVVHLIGFILGVVTGIILLKTGLRGKEE
jgi:rhomboid protease GluP